MSRNRRSSRGPSLADPSAMFADTETAARLTWEVSPYRSSGGQSLVTR